MSKIAQAAPPPPKTYERAKDTAAKIRARLKKEFPTCKFSVRAKEYAGGNSVSVSYVDGPALRTVERIAGAYESADFDPMQDLKTHPGYTDPETGQRVSGADWVNVNRSYTKAALLRAIREVFAKHDGREVPGDFAGARKLALDAFEPVSGHSFLCLAYGELAEQDLAPYAGKVVDAWKNADVAL